MNTLHQCIHANCALEVLKAINKINSYVEGMSLSDFQKSELTQDAVVRNLQLLRDYYRWSNRTHPQVGEVIGLVPMPLAIVGMIDGGQASKIWQLIGEFLPMYSESTMRIYRVLIGDEKKCECIPSATAGKAV